MRSKRSVEKKKQDAILRILVLLSGGKVAVISETDGNMIVNVKEARVAIGKDMANKIMI